MVLKMEYWPQINVITEKIAQIMNLKWFKTEKCIFFKICLNMFF